MKQGGYRSGSDFQARPAASGAGFTIVETLIVLAVTSALFIAAAVIINGRQAKTQFMVGINDAKQQMQQVINETVSGYYPNNASFDCKRNNNGPVITPGTAGQGANGECIFLGKSVYFGPINNPTTNYKVFAIAGNRLNAFDKDVSTMAEAAPGIVAPGNMLNSTAPDVTEVKKLQNQLEYAWGGNSANNNPANNHFAFGILRNLSTNGATGQSGTDQFGLYGYSSYGGAGSVQALVSHLDRVIPTPLASASICLASGTTNQSGLLTIDNSLTVQLKIITGNTTCS